MKRTCQRDNLKKIITQLSIEILKHFNFVISFAEIFAIFREFSTSSHNVLWGELNSTYSLSQGLLTVGVIGNWIKKYMGYQGQLLATICQGIDLWKRIPPWFRNRNWKSFKMFENNQCWADLFIHLKGLGHEIEFTYLDKNNQL